MFKNQPKGLYFLSLANTGERFGYYTMLAVFLLYLQTKFGFDAAVSGQIYAIFMAVVYFLPVIGGWLADRWSFNKCVITGIFVMFFGYLVLAIPTDIRSTSSLLIMLGALLLIAAGTGLFKGNLQVMIGDLYNEKRYAAQRDAGYSLFYMAINIGSVFAPSVATWMCDIALNSQSLSYSATLATACNQLLSGHEVSAQVVAAAQEIGITVGSNVSAFAEHYIVTLSRGYNMGFGVACISLVVSFIIYTWGKKSFAHIIKDNKKKEAKADAKAEAAAASDEPELTPQQTRQRIVALLLVFGVVIFFWMVFNQSGATLTEYAKSCVDPNAGGWTRVGFNLWALLTVAVGVFALFGIFDSKSKSGKGISALILLICATLMWYFYSITPNPVTGLQPQIYQQFNPFFVIALTPVSIAFFAWLASKGKEPSAPRKIGYGMLMAALAYTVLMIGSWHIAGVTGSVSGNWLISTYLLLTLAELLLSPMGISFVSKVAPPKYKGMMMGGWFASTAIGNYLVSIPMLLWGKISVAWVWGILILLCLLSGAVIFALMRRLESATK